MLVNILPTPEKKIHKPCLLAIVSGALLGVGYSQIITEPQDIIPGIAQPACTIVNDKLYAAGGLKKGYFNLDVFELDLKDNTWRLDQLGAAPWVKKPPINFGGAPGVKLGNSPGKYRFISSDELVRVPGTSSQVYIILNPSDEGKALLAKLDFSEMKVVNNSIIPYLGHSATGIHVSPVLNTHSFCTMKQDITSPGVYYIKWTNYGSVQYSEYVPEYTDYTSTSLNDNVLFIFNEARLKWTRIKVQNEKKEEVNFVYEGLYYTISVKNYDLKTKNNDGEEAINDASKTKSGDQIKTDERQKEEMRQPEQEDFKLIFFNPLTRKWGNNSTTGTTPIPTKITKILLVDSKVYTFTNTRYGVASDLLSDYIYILDLLTLTWERKRVPGFNGARTSCVNYYDGFLFQSFGSREYGNIERLDNITQIIDTRTWQKVSYMGEKIEDPDTLPLPSESNADDLKQKFANFFKSTAFLIVISIVGSAAFFTTLVLFFKIKGISFKKEFVPPEPILEPVWVDTAVKFKQEKIPLEFQLTELTSSEGFETLGPVSYHYEKRYI